MPRSTLSAASFKSIYASETDEVFLTLMTLNHSSFAYPITVCDEGQTVISNGIVYYGYEFMFQWPDDQDSQLPQAMLVISNVSPRLRQAVKQVNRTPISAVAQSIRASAPNLVDVTFNFVITNIKNDGQNITGTMIFVNFYQEPFPKDLIAPHNFPGVFA